MHIFNASLWLSGNFFDSSSRERKVDFGSQEADSRISLTQQTRCETKAAPDIELMTPLCLNYHQAGLVRIVTMKVS